MKIRFIQQAKKDHHMKWHGHDSWEVSGHTLQIITIYHYCSNSILISSSSSISTSRTSSIRSNYTGKILKGSNALYATVTFEIFEYEFGDWHDNCWYMEQLRFKRDESCIEWIYILSYIHIRRGFVICEVVNVVLTERKEGGTDCTLYAVAVAQRARCRFDEFSLLVDVWIFYMKFGCSNYEFVICNL